MVKKLPQGLERIKTQLDKFQSDIRKASNADMSTTRKNEITWGVQRALRARSKFLWEERHHRKGIADKEWRFLEKEGLVDVDLTRLWNAPERRYLCCAQCAVDDSLHGSKCICLVPEHKLNNGGPHRPCAKCGCRGCSPQDVVGSKKENPSATASTVDGGGRTLRAQDYYSDREAARAAGLALPGARPDEDLACQDPELVGLAVGQTLPANRAASNSAADYTAGGRSPRGVSRDPLSSDLNPALLFNPLAMLNPLALGNPISAGVLAAKPATVTLKMDENPFIRSAAHSLGGEAAAGEAEEGVAEEEAKAREDDNEEELAPQRLAANPVASNPLGGNPPAN